MLGHKTSLVTGIDDLVSKITEKENQKNKNQGELSSFDSKKNIEKIQTLIRHLGILTDWQNFLKTSDRKFGDCIKEAFFQLYQKGFLTRENRFVFWSFGLNSIVSEEETKTISTSPSKPTILSIPGLDFDIEFGHVYLIRYQLVDSDECIEVATSRPEMLLGESAVAIDPDSKKFENLIGKYVKNPLTGKIVPLIPDQNLAKRFEGASATSVSGCSGSFEYEFATKFGLPIKFFLDSEGKIDEDGGIFRGLNRFECRKRVCDELLISKSLAARTYQSMELRICKHTGDVIEEVPKEGWFFHLSKFRRELARLAEDGRISFSSQEEKDNWIKKANEVNDWCLSRQRQFGHRIPAHKLLKDGEIEWCFSEIRDSNSKGDSLNLGSNSSENPEDLVRDRDVIDPWFVASLLPLFVQGWPGMKVDFDFEFPLTSIIAEKSVLREWAMKIAAISLAITEKLPFTDISASKALYNQKQKDLIDFINFDFFENKQRLLDTKFSARNETSDDFGADCLRLFLISKEVDEQIRFDEGIMNEMKIVSLKSFSIWKALVLRDLETTDLREVSKWNRSPSTSSELNEKIFELSDFQHWMFHRLSLLVKSQEEHFLKKDLSGALNLLLSFYQQDFLDIFMKIYFKRSQTNPSLKETQFAGFVLFQFLKLFHPFAPFFTEEIYAKLPLSKRLDSIGLEPLELHQSFLSLKGEGFDPIVRVLKKILYINTVIKPSESISIEVFSSDPKKTMSDFKEFKKTISNDFVFSSVSPKNLNGLLDVGNGMSLRYKVSDFEQKKQVSSSLLEKIMKLKYFIDERKIYRNGSEPLAVDQKELEDLEKKKQELEIFETIYYGIIH